MNTYEKNLQAIGERNLYLKNALLNLKKTELSENIGMEQAKSGDYISFIKQDEKKLYLGSRYNPVHEAERWVRQFQFRSDENVMGMLGFGVGYFLRGMIQLEQVQYVIVYEPDIQLFYHTLHNYNLCDVLKSEKVKLIVKGLNEELSFRVIGGALNLNNVRSLQTAVHPGYDNVYEADKKIFLEQLLHVQSNIFMYLNTNAAFGVEWMMNTLYNMRYLRNSNVGPEFLNVIDKKTPVIAVMAGPSVADEIEDLKKAKGIFPIFCVDRIADFLMEHGVEPDAVFTVDAMIEFGVERMSHIPLVGNLCSRRLLFGRHSGKKILTIYKKFPGDIYIKLDKSVGRYEAANTISSMLMGMLAAEGIEKVILVGQDLAFRGEVSHADGSEEKKSYFKDNIYVEGMNGEKIRTRSDWEVMLNWYKGFLAAYPNCKVYDSKETGAKIHGTEQKKIRELLAEGDWEKRDYVKCFNELEPTFNEAEWEQVLAYLAEVDNDMEHILEVLPEAIEAAEYFLKNSPEKRTRTRSEKNVSLMKDVNQIMLKGAIASMVEELIEAHLGKELLLLNQREDTFDKKEEKVYATAKQMYTGLESILKMIQPEYNEMLQMMKADRL